MKRTITEALLRWKNDPARKPLLLTGVRQCGKTWLLRDFCGQHFEQTAYLNFEKETQASQIFDYDLDPRRIIRELGSLFFGFEIIPGKTALILDEIQACPRAVTSLKYFCEDMPDLHVLCAGSLLGVEIKRQNVSFPVGKVNRLQLYPMSFEEFLIADGGQKYLDLAMSREPEAPLPELCAGPLEKAYRNYLVIGGMPAAVSTWCTSHDYKQVDMVLDDILADYAGDFAKHAPAAIVPRIHWVWDSVPKQLAKDNNKFVFSHVKEGKRSYDLEDALIWLRDAGLVYQTELAEKPETPLSNSANAASFKVYMSDTGLLRRKAGLDYRPVLQPEEMGSGFKGALTENYVQNQLISKGYTPYFWRSGNQAEVDFLIESKGSIIPIEVKSATNTKAKSYRLFCRQYRIARGFRMSLKNIAVNEESGTRTVSLPLYLIPQMERYLE